MSQGKSREIRETTLVLSNKEILIKHRRAYRNETGRSITGEQFTTLLPVISAQAKDKNGDLETKITLNGNSTIISWKYREPINPRSICATELSILIEDNITNKLGDLRILDWPKEDLSEIYFLHTKPFFISAIGNVTNNKVSPLAGFKSIICHAREGKTIRIEYLPKDSEPPVLLWTDLYTVYNDSEIDVEDTELKIQVPRNDKMQRVSISSLSPISLEKDKDGNVWGIISINKLKPYEKKQIKITYKIKRYAYRFFNDYGDISFLNNIVKETNLYKQFLSATKLWPTNEPQIKRIAKTILEGQKDLFSIIKLIFEFVNQTFSYEINGERYPATELLKTRKGDCSEFSDLFVTIARACKIPARVCTGYFWPLNNAIEGHAWCEVFTKNGWIQLDPLHGYLHGVSFRHILFAKESVNVDYPVFILTTNGENVKVNRNYSIKVL